MNSSPVQPKKAAGDVERTVPRRTWPTWIEPVWLSGLALLLCGLTWKKWPHALIDFGRELYTPWQLSEGQVLYRDVEAIFGPLSQYVNATWFRIAGTSLTSLCLLNLVLLIGLTLMMHSIFRRIAGRGTANLASVCFLTVFAFAQYNLVGNNNFIAPYSHEATHGVILSVAMICGLIRFAENPSRRWVALAGLCAGATLLTKPEIAVAAIGTAFSGFVALAATQRSHGTKLRRPVGIFVASAATPLAGFFVYFRQHMTTAESLEAVGGAFRFLVGKGITSNAFYQSVTGFDEPWANLAKMALVLVGSAIAIAVLVAGARYLAQPSAYVARAVSTDSRAKLIVVIVALMLGLRLVPWFDIARPLPLFCVGAAGVVVFRILRSRREWNAMHREFPLLLWSCFAALMLTKIALKTTVAHYGFYLAMPATLLAVVTLHSLVPQLLFERSNPESARVLRPAITAFAIAGMVVLTSRSHSIYSMKNLTVGTDADQFTSFDADTELVATGVADALEIIGREVPADATMVVLPEGIMLNYLARRSSTVPYINFMPPELMAFGETNIIDAMQSSPPDYIVIAHKDASEYGVGNFGTDPRNGQKLMKWVNRNYRREQTVLNEPFVGEQFGMAILVREPDAVVSATEDNFNR